MIFFLFFFLNPTIQLFYKKRHLKSLQYFVCYISKVYPQLCASGREFKSSGSVLSACRSAQLWYDGPQWETASLPHSHLLYIPDRWQGVHSLRRVKRTVDVWRAERTRHRQRTDWTRVTVHRSPAAIRLTQLLLDQFPLFGSAILKPDFHLKRQNNSIRHIIWNIGSQISQSCL